LRRGTGEGRGTGHSASDRGGEEELDMVTEIEDEEELETAPETEEGEEQAKVQMRWW
jgi:hypothetical protein